MLAAHINEVSGDDYLWLVPKYDIAAFDLEYQPINLFYLEEKVDKFCNA